MKYINDIVIRRPISEVLANFDNVENMKHWQPGLVSFETILGNPGEEGAESRLVYQIGRRRVEMKEVIEVKNLPRQFSGVYETKGVWNRVDNRFTDLGNNRTEWIATNQFKFSGFMKIMGWLAPGAFKRQSNKYMEYFKDFVENGVSVLSEKPSQP